MGKLWLLLAIAAAPALAQSDDVAFFESKIRPALANHCYVCHSSSLPEPMGGLRLDTKAGTLAGGLSGPLFAPGEPAGSLLLRAIEYNDLRLKMPPTGKLPDNVIDDFKRWIAIGAPDPREDAPSVQAAPKKESIDLAKGRQWWAFQPLSELAAPPLQDSAWPRQKLDSFVLSRLEKSGVKPSPEAAARHLIHRAYLDLTGLRPTYADVEAFVSDSAPGRYENLINRLLESPQYGERWARYWLDIARYAEDNRGNITNPPYPYAWRYRDWVIEALNADTPFDRFVTLQLAADHLADADRDDLRALGYLGLSPIEHKDGRLSKEVTALAVLDEWEERVDAVSRGLMGLSVACARCHDHKFDPIPTSDYYSLAGVFASTQRATRPLFEIDSETETRFVWIRQRLFDLHYFANLLERAPGSKPEQAARQVKTFRAEIAALDSDIAAMSERYPQLAEHMKQVRFNGEVPVRKGLEDPSEPFINAIYDAGLWLDDSEPDVTLMDYRPGQPRDLPVFRGGNFSTPGEIIQRGFLSVMAENSNERFFDHGSGRLELAQALFSDAAALTARVIVNRVWGWHFGKPLARTPSDFGSQGEKPTHPDLLDDLSARFIQNGWSLKWLHREIMLSATYRQSSQPREGAYERDPDNKLLWRMNPRRLDIEAYRDTILQAAEALDPAAGGPSEPIEKSTRRTIYSTISRGRDSGVLGLYDFPEPVQHSPQRTLTITPLQQLFVINSAFLEEQAAALAQAVESLPDGRGRVESLYRKILSRDPNADEIDRALSYLASETWESYAQALLAANEVIFWP